MSDITLWNEIELRGWRIDPDYGDFYRGEPDTFYIWAGDEIIGTGDTLESAYEDAIKERR